MYMAMNRTPFDRPIAIFVPIAASVLALLAMTPLHAQLAPRHHQRARKRQ